MDVRRLPGEPDQGGRGRRLVELHQEQRVDAHQAALAAQRRILLVLRGALPGRHLHDPDTPEAALLRLQHDPAVPPDHAGRPARLLHPKRLRREGYHGNYDAAVDDRLPDVGHGEHAAYVRRSTSYR